jgi:hypothetical protein
MFRYEVVLKERCFFFFSKLIVKESKVKDEKKLIDWCEKKYGRKFVGLRVLPV